MLKAFYKCDVWDSNKDPIFKGRRYKSKSFVNAFIRLMYREMGSIFHSVNDIDGVGQSDGYEENQLFSISVGGDSTQISSRDGGTNQIVRIFDPDKISIVVGTGTNAVAVGDDSLQTIISNGTSTGNLEYHGTRAQNYSMDTGTDTSQFELERIFRNSSGGSITVNELGIYCAADNHSFCIVRDKLTSGVAVTDGQYLKVKYTIKVVV